MSNPTLQSIYLVSTLVQKGSGRKSLAPTVSTYLKTPDNVSSLLDSLRFVSESVARQLQDIKEPKERGLEIFESLSIQYDEVIHSNAIAKCFSDVSPTVAKTLLTHCFTMMGTPIAFSPAKILVTKERALGSLPNAWKIDSSIHGRRLDILIEHPQAILAIENKIESRESERQTRDYFSALQLAFGEDRKILGVFLSPDKLQPECESFHAMDYVDLYRILESALSENSGERVGFLRFYAKEVFDVFVQQRRNTYVQTIEYWKGKSA